MCRIHVNSLHLGINYLKRLARNKRGGRLNFRLLYVRILVTFLNTFGRNVQLLGNHNSEFLKRLFTNLLRTIENAGHVETNIDPNYRQTRIVSQESTMICVLVNWKYWIEGDHEELSELVRYTSALGHGPYQLSRQRI